MANQQEPAKPAERVLRREAFGGKRVLEARESGAETVEARGWRHAPFHLSRPHAGGI